ncbi:protein MALE DISCOVERER 2-like isoform X1 [Actinidia eriantha]|uniref:protein MALE DISCOVERER 2-like isoform X1 n=1 Tax=Actinidia eriantha TaxID=165200 RepID=UPI00258E7248|nr:protein MALE DISCOVERER 2-like isoform X1 [Actinidia eriantha]
MVCKAMGLRCDTCGIQLSCFAILILVLGNQGCWSLNYEGSALLEFRGGVDYDPYGVFANWNPIDNNPCGWSGVRCVYGEVEMLDLNGLSLEGELVPELGKLTHLRFLVLCNNQFYGAIPKDIGGLTMLEVLDLRNNNLSGTIPTELGGLRSLKRLLLCNNNFNGDFPSEFGSLNLLSELQFDENLTFAVTTGTGCVNKKFGHCIWWSCLKQPKKADPSTIKGTLLSFVNVLSLFKSEKDSLHGTEYNCCDNLQTGTNEEHMVHNVQNLVNIGRRRLFQQSSNLAAVPAIGRAPWEKITSAPITRSSGSFPAIPKGQLHPSTQQGTSNPDNKPTDQKPSSNGTSGHAWKYIVGGSVGVVLLLVSMTMFFMCRSRAVSTIGPWKTGLSGQLQKAFVTGVPKLNRAELETACEDFSNIIETIDGGTIYKGTLSSGVEIAVASTAIFSVKDWSKRSEVTYRKKIDTLSRVNHKNFVNLIGYCEEEEPFTRMMVFEYAPNGTLFEHLHVKEVEHLDWNARTRIIMGTAYCLQYMHDLNPPVAHSNLNSNAIFLTDDYAAKIAEICFGTEATSKSRISGENESEHSELPPFSDPETNVLCFGMLLIEIISGKLPYSEVQGPLVNWADQYLNDKRSIRYLIDPTLKNFKNNELDVICEVIQDCIQPDARKRPTMKEITSKLREVIAITPDAATPRLSPLWWAELEILSVEAA